MSQVPLFPNCELAFANSAYLSELWAVQDLIRQKRLFHTQWNNEREKQLRDEVRHARRLLDFLTGNGSPVVVDIAYSMQVRLYGPQVDLSKTETLEEAAAVHDLTEHRASWIYRTYLKHGKDDSLRIICTEILEDEKSHFPVNNSVEISRFTQLLLNGIDRKIFRSELPSKFGRVMLFSNDFWNNYFDGATAHAAALENHKILVEAVS